VRKQPFVSVAMPVYNGENYFELALKSALAQSYEHFEIVVVNDGSTDGGATAAIGKAYAIKHPDRVKYFEKPNGGVGSALNFAITKMQGDIFCWLSHDDLYSYDKIEKQATFWMSLSDRNASVICDYSVIDPDGNLIGDVRFNREVFILSPGLPLFRGCVNGNCVFIPIHLVKQYRFDETKKYTQDYDLWNELARLTTFYHLPFSLTSYRIHPNQESKKPEAVTEGNELWLKMINGVSLTDKFHFYGSSWRFYNETQKVLADSGYSVALDYLENRLHRCISETLVTVVIPFFNEVDLVIRAMNSVLSQSHQNLEILLVNDGSTEDLGSLYEIVEKTPKIALLNQENSGAGNARNLGLDYASGDYIAFLDADDQFLPEKIERQLKAMMLRGAAFSHTSYFVTYQGCRTGYGILRSGKFTGNVFPAIIGGCPIATPTVMVHRALVAEGFRFAGKVKLGEDVLCWTDIASKYLILGIDDPLSIVEWSDASAAIDLMKCIDGVSEIAKFLSKHPIYRRYSKQIELLLSGGLCYYKHLQAGNTKDTKLINLAFGPVGDELNEVRANDEPDYLEGPPMHYNGARPLQMFL
jgi:glycosyltransferase involved in cell wall biosynthesis